MNEMLHLSCMGLFLVLVPSFLFMKFKKQKPNWWIISLVILGLGWLLVFGTFTFYQAHIGDLIAHSEELPDGWDSDGASGIAALLFGWLISLIYALPWLVIYALAAGIRQWRQKAQAA